MQHDDKEERAKRRSQEKAGDGVKVLEDAGIRQALASAEGREFIWWLLATAGVGALPWDPSSDRETAFRLGELNVGHQILARIIELNPHAYVQMQLEHAENGSSSAEPGNASRGTVTFSDDPSGDDA